MLSHAIVVIVVVVIAAICIVGGSMFDTSRIQRSIVQKYWQPILLSPKEQVKIRRVLLSKDEGNEEDEGPIFLAG